MVENEPQEQQQEMEEEEHNKPYNPNVMAQFPLLNGYTHLVLGFKLQANTSADIVVTAIQAAVNKLIAQIPWLGGQVILNVHKSAKSRVWMPAPWPVDSPANEIVRVKHCEDTVPTMDQILHAGAPIRLLDGKILAPFPGLLEPHGIVGPAPIVALQANFIHGGLILDLSLHHNVIDATGILQFTLLLATILADRNIPAADLEQANRDCSKVVPLIPPGDPLLDHSYLRQPLNFTPLRPSSSHTWCYFKLPTSVIPTLKNLALSSMLLSEQDVICAFCWKRISAVRLARGSHKFAPRTMCRFKRTIDGRVALNVPFTYMGHMVYFATTQLSLEQVVSLPLSIVALALRRELNAANTAWAVRSYATFLAREPDKSKLMYTGPHNPDIDLGATSTILGVEAPQKAISAFPNSFGPLLGSSSFFRRPYLAPMPGSITISPVENGAIPIVMCLPEEDLEDLKKDTEWKQYMRYVG